MRFPRFLKLSTVGGGLLIALVGVAYAQDSKSGTPTTAGMTQTVKLTPEEQLKASDSTIARIDQVATSVRKQLEQARSQRDVVKTLCLNDKLTQIDVAGRSARDRKEALRQAVSRQDTELSSHEFTILTVIRERVDQLSAEAQQCIGEEAGFSGETRVTVTINPNLPTGDSSDYPSDTIISVPPECTSCSS